MKEKIEQLLEERDVRLISHDTLVQELLLLINKPVETTNELPEKYKLEEWFLDQIEEIKDKYGYMQKHYTPLATSISNKRLCMLFNGVELILLSDGTYILGDTTGG